MVGGQLQTLGDLIMAEECLRLAIASDNRHALAYNNLGVIEMRNGNVTAARIYFHAAANIASYVYEAHFNSAHLAYEVIISNLPIWRYAVYKRHYKFAGWGFTNELHRSTKIVARISRTLRQQNNLAETSKILLAHMRHSAFFLHCAFIQIY